MSIVIRTHPRLTFGVLAGCIAGLLVPAQTLTGKILIGWNVAVWTYLALMFWLTVRARADQVKRIAEAEDENAGLVLLIVCVAAIASLVAITLELVGSKDLDTTRRLLHYGFTGLTVIGSWLLVG